VFTSKRAYDTTILPVVNKNSVYSVFITYLEIYNNFVYDLLDEAPVENGGKGMIRRMLREDGNHNVYVNQITEIEVQSADEAFDVFNRGQRQRRMAHTILNTESSRSHSIFNIRLVQVCN
jgi:kinesin family protein 23